MRLTRKTCLAATLMITMAALMTSTANAVEVSAEDGGHCTEVDVSTSGSHTVTGGCLIHVATEPNEPMRVTAHFQTVAEVVLAACNSEVSARVHESGTLLIYNQVFTPSNCGIALCAEPGDVKIPWSADLMEFPVGAGTQEALDITVCISAGGPPTVPCTVYIPVVTGGEHDYEFRTMAAGPSVPTIGGAPLQSRCSQGAAAAITATHWDITGTPIEIAH